jgi:hypothetical protein
MSETLLLKKLLSMGKKKVHWLDRILIVFLGLGLVLILVFFVYLLWFTYTNRSVTHILPAEKTVAYFELEDLSLPPKLGQETVFDLVGLTAILKKGFGLEIFEIKEHLAKGRLGMALLKSDTGDNEPVLFFRVKSQKEVLAFLEGSTLEGETLIAQGTPAQVIYSFPKSRPFSFSFIGPHLFIAQNPACLETIHKVHRGELPSLNGDASFQKSLANLPGKSWGFGFVDAQQLQFQAGQPLNQIVQPLKTVADHFALAVRKEYNGFHFNSLLALNPDALELGKGYSDRTRFHYQLTDYVSSQKLAAYLGGANLADEWQNTLHTLANLNPAYGIILEGLLRAQIQQYFGEEVSLRNDFYPLFENEYAFVLEDLPNGHPGFKLILRHDDRVFAEAKLSKLLDGFRILAAKFAPKLNEFTLPDGTESRELVADPTRLKEYEETYEGYPLRCLDVTDSPYGFCFAITDQLVIIGNHPNTVKDTIDLTASPKFVLSQNQSFQKVMGNVSAISDEVSYLHIPTLVNVLGNTPAGFRVNNLLSEFEAVAWVKHYFDDGVSTEGYLLLQ